jgi:ribosomal protein L37E
LIRYVVIKLGRTHQATGSYLNAVVALWSKMKAKAATKVKALVRDQIIHAIRQGRKPFHLSDLRCARCGTGLTYEQLQALKARKAERVQCLTPCLAVYEWVGGDPELNAAWDQAIELDDYRDQRLKENRD